MGLKSQTKNYAELAERLRLGKREISKLAKTTDTTVKRVLRVDRSKGFYSVETEHRVHRAIDVEADKLRDYLNRLSGGATGS